MGPAVLSYSGKCLNGANFRIIMLYAASTYENKNYTIYNI